MKVMWIGLKITEKQYKKLEKSDFRMNLQALEGAEFIGRKFKHDDFIPGNIMDYQDGDEFIIYNKKNVMGVI